MVLNVLLFPMEPKTPPMANMSVKNSGGSDKPKKVIKRMTDEQMTTVQNVCVDRRNRRADAFYGNDESVSNLGPINPLGFLPTPPKSASGRCLPHMEVKSDEKVLSVPRRLHAFYAETQGRRPSMEDQLFLANISLDGAACIDLVAIFDGHSGPDVPLHLKETMVPIFEKHLRHFLAKEKSQSGDTLNTAEDVIRKAFQEANQSVKESKVAGGSTALILMYHEDKIYFGNTGDCRAVISHDECNAKRITTDHKPDNPKERQRLEAMGATITQQTLRSGKDIFRLEGILGLSRAFGDFQIEPYITSDPDVFVISASELDSEFIVMACDGLWDELSDQDCVKIVRGHLEQTPGDWEGACCRLRNASYASGSTDNITCLIVHNGTSFASVKADQRDSTNSKWNRNTITLSKDANFSVTHPGADEKSKYQTNRPPRINAMATSSNPRMRSVSEAVSPREKKVNSNAPRPIVSSEGKSGSQKSRIENSPQSPNRLSHELPTSQQQGENVDTTEGTKNNNAGTNGMNSFLFGEDSSEDDGDVNSAQCRSSHLESMNNDQPPIISELPNSVEEKRNSLNNVISSASDLGISSSFDGKLRESEKGKKKIDKRTSSNERKVSVSDKKKDKPRRLSIASVNIVKKFSSADRDDGDQSSSPQTPSSLDKKRDRKQSGSPSESVVIRKSSLGPDEVDGSNKKAT